jgi:hypothetical protein
LILHAKVPPELFTMMVNVTGGRSKAREHVQPVRTKNRTCWMVHIRGMGVIPPNAVNGHFDGQTRSSFLRVPDNSDGISVDQVTL